MGEDLCLSERAYFSQPAIVEYSVGSFNQSVKGLSFSLSVALWSVADRREGEQRQEGTQILPGAHTQSVIP